MHFHFARNSVQRGANTYQTCRCGAQRVVRGRRGYSPVVNGWAESWRRVGGRP